jgi:hypothetical protein
MSSSYSSRLDIQLKNLLMNLATLEQLRIVSIEYTVLRENKRPIGLEVFIQCLLAEQKEDLLIENGHSHVKKDGLWVEKEK